MRADQWSCPDNIYKVEYDSATKRLNAECCHNNEWKAVLVCGNGMALSAASDDIMGGSQDNVLTSDGVSTNHYYFEVTVQSGRAWIGLMTSESCLVHENGADQAYPYDVALNKFPGSFQGSLGLGTDGAILVNGRLMDDQALVCGVSVGDTIGCGLELDAQRIFFTYNGSLVVSGISALDLMGTTHDLLCPTIGLDLTPKTSTVGTSVTCNFGASLDEFIWKGTPQIEENGSNGHNLSLSAGDLEEKTKDFLLMLRDAIAFSSTDPSVVRELLDASKSHLESVQSYLQHDSSTDLGALFDAYLSLDAKVAEAYRLVNDCFIEPEQSHDHPPDLGICHPNALEGKEDIFDLLCILRDPSSKCVEAAKALLHLVKGDFDNAENKSREQVSQEVRSCGGLVALFSSFTPKSKEKIENMNVYVALIVAQLVTSGICAHEGCQSIKCYRVIPKIVECLRFLWEESSLSWSYEEVVNMSQSDVQKLISSGLINISLMIEPIWINFEEAYINPSRVRTNVLGKRNLSRLRSRQQHQQQQYWICLETFISFVTFVANEEYSKVENCRAKQSTALAVASICTNQRARLIAVREGLLTALFGWLKSSDNELINTAVGVLRDLTSTSEEYMAGWVHSQIVNERILTQVIRLTESNEMSVRLGAAEILSNLAAASHTQAAIIEENGVGCIVHLLVTTLRDYHLDEPRIAYYAGKALIDITTRDVNGSTSDDQYNFIRMIFDGGGIDALVAIANIEDFINLRLVSVHLLKIVSDKNMPKIRQKMIRNGAISTMGAILKQDSIAMFKIMFPHISSTPVESIEKGLITKCPDQTDSQMQELYFALHALANMLELFSVDVIKDPTGCTGDMIDMLILHEHESPYYINGACSVICNDVLKSGAIESLLLMTMLFNSTAKFASPVVSVNQDDLCLESYRSLASLCPLLLSPYASTTGLTQKFTLQVFYAITSILNEDERNFEAQCEALRGLLSLSNCHPLQARIQNSLLPILFHFKRFTYDPNIPEVKGELSQGAESILNALEIFEENHHLSEWNHIDRDLLVQAMARDEIKYALHGIWNESLVLISKSMPKVTGDDQTLRLMFQNIVNDSGSFDLRSKILDEYAKIYEQKNNDDRNYSQYAMWGEMVGSGFNEPLIETNHQKRGENYNDSVAEIQRHHGSLNEKDWFLLHRRYELNDIDPDALTEKRLKSCVPASSRLEDFLSCHFPSNLLRSAIVCPLCDLRPDASFNFRSFSMPERRYVSFRSEGKMLSKLYRKHEQCSDAIFNLQFRNSNFAGEFVETLLQTLHRCPMFKSLSFLRDKGVAASGLEGDAHGSAMLSYLATNCPSWVQYLTFDGTLSQTAVNLWIDLLSARPKRLHVHGQNTSSQSVQETHGALYGLAIINSPHLEEKNFSDLVNKMGFGPKLQNNNSNSTERPSPHIHNSLKSLRYLDLSGNGLGPSVCSTIFGAVCSPNPISSLVGLDLSNNKIGKGSSILSILQTFSMNQTGASWTCILERLNLASNNLGSGHLGTEIVNVVDKLTKLKALNLSDNFLSGDEHLANNAAILLKHKLSGLLQNSTLLEFDLSKNALNTSTLSVLFAAMNSKSKTGTIPFLHIDSNMPNLTDNQSEQLLLYIKHSRINRATNYFQTGKVNMSNDDINEEEIVSPRDRGSMPVTNEYYHGIRTGEKTSAIHNPNTTFAQDADYNVTVLFSSPLVWKDRRTEKLRPIEMADQELERRTLTQAFKEASVDIELSIDTCTTSRLQHTMAKRCKCLHFSSPAHHARLIFEDDRMGMQFMTEEELQQTMNPYCGSDAPFKFVFVSQVSDENTSFAAQSFLKAGVPHVVCCNKRPHDMDHAALAFMRAFYIALVRGETVKISFEIGCQTVSTASSPPIDKFKLLPEEGDHNRAIFRGNTIPAWQMSPTDSSKFECILPSRPEHFLGREVDTYSVVEFVLSRRFVSLIARVSGIGRSSLAKMVCHSIVDRFSTMSVTITHIFYIPCAVSVHSAANDNFMHVLYKQLIQAEIVTDQSAEDSGTQFEELVDRIVDALRYTKALLVFDGIEENDEAIRTQTLPYFLNILFRDTKNVRVLLVGRERITKPNLGICSFSGVGEFVYSLGPLNYKNTVRLFSMNCPHVQTIGAHERQRLQKMVSAEEGLMTSFESDCRSDEIFKALGEGTPAKILDVATHIKRDDYDHLWRDQNI